MNVEPIEPGPARPPTHEAFWPEDLFTQGLGWVIVARFKSAGQRVEAGIFLVDAYCLGVKLAAYELCDAEDYRQRIRDHYMADFPMIPVEPWCARKFVEQAVQYAQGLGLGPHPDYKKAARVFGGLNAAQCDRQFAFGHKGKPLYIRGPRETEEQAHRIVEHLGRRCGPGKFDYMVGLVDAGESDGALEP